MKLGAWNKKRSLLEEKDRLLAKCRSATGFSSEMLMKLQEINKALAAEDERHRRAVQNFKVSRRKWKLNRSS